MNSETKKQAPWWSEEYGFFGDFYMDGDDSKEGYLIEKKQRLAERTNEESSGVIKLLGDTSSKNPRLSLRLWKT